MGIGALIFLLAVGARFFFSSANNKQSYNESVEEQKALIIGITNNEELIGVLAYTNEFHKLLSEEEILSLDDNWIHSNEDNDVMRRIMGGKGTGVLTEFQRKNPGFVEIFVTDVVGMNIAQTNKTSDYYQADEAWWQEAYNEGRGKVYHGEIEYDESAGRWVTPMYSPIYNDNREVIGIIKALLDVEYVR